MWKGGEESASKRFRKEAPKSAMPESTKTRVIKTVYFDGIKKKPSFKTYKSF